MFEVIGLIILAIWTGKKSNQANRNPYKWGLISAGLYILFYSLIFIPSTKGFEKIFDKGNDAAVASMILSWGLIPICFVIATYFTEKLMNKRQAEKETA